MRLIVRGVQSQKRTSQIDWPHHYHRASERLAGRRGPIDIQNDVEIYSA